MRLDGDSWDGAIGTRCAACGWAEVSQRIETREMMVGLREPFTYHRCERCRSLWLTDPPEDLAPYYAGAYYSMRTPAPKADAWTKLRAAAALRLPARIVDRAGRVRGLSGTPWFARWLAGLGIKRTDKIGDIGSGAGQLLAEMRVHGFRDLWGFDPFLSDASDADGIHLRKTDVSGAPDGFKLLMSHHSLEHVPDPLAALRTARRKLAAGGVLLVRLPVADSYADRTYGGDWVALDPPRHLWIPSEDGMLRLAGSAGFTTTRIFYDSSELQFYASEQYQRDVPLCDPRSVAEGSEVVFDRADLLAFKQRAAELNARSAGDSAGFVLRPDDSVA